jgi:hypothetical protein
VKTSCLSAIAFCASLILFCSCGEKKSDIVSIDLKNCAAPSELLEPDFEIIPLETTEESLIAYLDKVKICDSCFFISDRTQKAILIFDWKGKFVNKICRLGRGPGEYTDISDFDVYNGHVYVYSGGLGKILRYNFNGKYVDCSEELDADCRFILPINNDSILLFADNTSPLYKQNFSILDWNSNKIVARWDEYGDNSGMTIDRYAMNRTDDGILLSKSFDHALYKYDHSGFGKLIEFDFPGIDPIPETPVNHYEKSKFIGQNSMCVVSTFEQAMMYKGKLYVDYSCTATRLHNGLEVSELKTYLSEINLDTKEHRTIEIGYLMDYKDYPFIGHTVALQDGILITEELCAGIVKWGSDLMTQFPEIANIKEDDNPFLVVHHIK